MSDERLRARIVGEVHDAVLLGEAYEGEKFPAHVREAFEICTERIEQACQALERRVWLRDARDAHELGKR